MRHTRTITRKPAKAQSAYASKLQFKQLASSDIAFNTLILVDSAMSVFQALLGNALSLGIFYVFTFDEQTT